MTYYLKKEWKWNALALLGKLLDSALAVGANVLMIALFQSVIDRNIRLFATMVAGFLGACVADNLVCIFAGWAMSRAKLAMNNRYRGDVVATLLGKNHQQLHQCDSGEYLSWLTNDVTQITTLAWDSFYGMVGLVAQVLLSAVALAAMHWLLLAASMVVALVVIQAPKLGQKRMASRSETCARQQARGTARLKDLLTGVDVLLAFGREDRFIRENREASNDLEVPNQKLKYTQTMVNEGINFVSTLCTLSVMLLIGVLAIRGILVQAVLSGGTNMISTISGGLAGLGQYRLAIQAAKPYFDKIAGHAGESPASRREEADFPMEEILLEDVFFAYGEKQVLEHGDFTFRKGGKYALIGPSGCGKSTVLKLLLGWLPDYRGTIRFDGRDARQVTQEQRLARMSYIQQDVFLFNTTIRDNITLGGNFSREQLEQAIRGSALEGDLAAMPLGLDTPVGEDGNNLSGGQKQRIAIARALIHDRSILLVDEGTSALDQKNADIVEKSLLENPDLTLILVSHHLSQERKNQFTRVYELKSVG